MHSGLLSFLLGDANERVYPTIVAETEKKTRKQKGDEDTEKERSAVSHSCFRIHK